MKVPASEVRGVGPLAVKALAVAGIHTVEDLAAASVAKIAAVPGFRKIRAEQVKKAAVVLMGGNLKTVQNETIPEAEPREDKKKKKVKKKKKKKDKGADVWDSYKRRAKRFSGKRISGTKVVTISYTLADERGKIIDRTGDGDALVYLHGSGCIVPGLEAALEGKTEGDKLQVNIPPENAYGPRVESLVQHVSHDHFTKVKDLQVGMRLQTHTEAGMHMVTVMKIEKDRVLVDGNHPLAGVTLNFDVAVLDVREATRTEIRDGCAHNIGKIASG